MVHFFFFLKTMKNFISKPEISFWIPIVTSAVLIAGTFFALQGRVALVDQKLDMTIAILNEIKGNQQVNLQAMNRLEAHVCKLDTIHDLSCIAW